MKAKLKEFFTSKVFAFLVFGIPLVGGILGLIDLFFLKSSIINNSAGYMVFIPFIIVGTICALAEYQDRTSALFCIPTGFLVVALFGGSVITATLFPLERAGLTREEFHIAFDNYRMVSFQIMGIIVVVLFLLRMILKSFNKLLPSLE